MAAGMTEMYPMGIGRARQVVAADGIFDLVREDLQRVEDAIGIESAACGGALTTSSKSPRPSPWTRVRAALLLLCARLTNGDRGGMAIQLGAVVEMLHAAPLAQADGFDVAQSRRGCPSGNVPWANRAGVLAGDWLYIRAFRVALRHGVLDQVIGASQMMVLGDLMQRDRPAVTEADCLELADRKTARLFSACGRVGAIVAGLDAPDRQKLAEFAWNLGMAFQLTGDVLAFVSPDLPPGRDLQDGIVTLPLVYALEQASATERALAARVLRDPGRDAASLADVLTLVDRCGGILRTRARARQFASCARETLADLPESLCRNSLLALAHLVAERDC